MLGIPLLLETCERADISESYLAQMRVSSKVLAALQLIADADQNKLTLAGV
jgi:hypothetical protein